MVERKLSTVSGLMLLFWAATTVSMEIQHVFCGKSKLLVGLMPLLWFGIHVHHYQT